jgi:hypothetical protein
VELGNQLVKQFNTVIAFDRLQILHFVQDDIKKVLPSWRISLDSG